MASYIENLVSKIGLDNIFQRKNSQPLDRSSIFGSLDDAEKYALFAGKTKEQQKILTLDSRKLGPTAYIGQIITVYENNNVNVYKINADSKLVLVGGNTSQDIANLTTNVTNLQTSASTLNTNISTISGSVETISDDVEFLRQTIEDNAKVTAYALIELKNKINNNNNSGDSGEDDIIQDGIIDCGTF